MKYDVTFSCGHTETVEIYGKTEDREKENCILRKKRNLP